MRKGWPRLILIAGLVVLGAVITILPQWWQGRRLNKGVLVWQGQGKIPDYPPPDTLILLYRLATVSDPEFGVDIVKMGLLESLNFDTLGNVRVVLGLTAPCCPYITPLGRSVLETLLNTPGVREAKVKIEPGLVIRR